MRDTEEAAPRASSRLSARWSRSGTALLEDRRPSPVASVILPMIVVVAVLIIWTVYAERSEGGVFPTVLETAEGFVNAATDPAAWQATWTSWRSLLIAFVIAVPIGIFLGLLMGASRTVDRALGVYLDISLVTPMIVLMPIVLIAIGITAKAEVIVIIFFAIPYMILPIRSGVRELPQLWFDLVRSLGASRSEVFRYVLLPGARTPIVRGLRLGFAHAVSGLFTVELTLAALGIGKVVLTSQSEFRLGDMLGYLFLVMTQVVIVMTLANRLDSNWREVTTA